MAKATSELLTTKEACEYLRIGKTLFYRQAAAKRIKNVRIGRAVRWKKWDLDRLVEACTSQRR